MQDILCDGLRRVVSGRKYWSDGTPVAGQQFEYGFDDIGNRTSAKAGGDANGMSLRSATYSANSLNQYTNRTVPGAVDILGIAKAPKTVTVNGQSPYRHGEYYRSELSLDNTSAVVYAGVTNQAVLDGATNTATGSVLLAQTPESYTYGADGNLTGDGLWTLTWDGENRLMGMESVAGVPTVAKRKLTFLYDYQGRRVSKSVSTNSGSGWVPQYERKCVYDGYRVVAELDGNDHLVRSYLWGLDLSGSLQGAGGVGGLVAIIGQTNGVHFVAQDGNGNVVALVDGGDADINATYEYGPFGELLRATGPAAFLNPFRFSTKFQDDETDLLYYGHRYYTPSTGRWPSRDPIAEKGGRNVYTYAFNCPVNFFDTDGREIGGICPRCGQYYVGHCPRDNYPDPPRGSSTCGQLVIVAIDASDIWWRCFDNALTAICIPHMFIIADDGTRLHLGGDASNEDHWTARKSTIYIGPDADCAEFTQCLKDYFDAREREGYDLLKRNCHVATDAIDSCGGYR